MISFIFIHVFHNLKFELAYWWIDYFSDQKNMGTLNINVAVFSVQCVYGATLTWGHIKYWKL